jgi:hypothetical protein
MQSSSSLMKVAKGFEGLHSSDAVLKKYWDGGICSPPVDTWSDYTINKSQN